MMSSLRTMTSSHLSVGATVMPVIMSDQSNKNYLCRLSARFRVGVGGARTVPHSDFSA